MIKKLLIAAAMLCGLFFVFFVPSQAAARIKVILRPKTVGDGMLRDWHSFAPIQSEHWGEAARSGE
jgi:hypothetical protein